MLPTNCEISLIFDWSTNCVISSNVAANQATILKILDTRLYATVITFSTLDNATLLLLQQLKSGFKPIISSATHKYLRRKL